MLIELLQKGNHFEFCLNCFKYSTWIPLYCVLSPGRHGWVLKNVPKTRADNFYTLSLLGLFSLCFWV